VTSLLEFLFWLVSVISVVNLLLRRLGLTPRVTDDIFAKLLATIVLTWAEVARGKSSFVDVWSVCLAHQGRAGA